MTVSPLARLWFGVTALVVAVGLAVQVPVAWSNESGYFDTSWERGLNVFVFFTVLSNIAVGVSTAVLALGRARPTNPFRTVRLIGVVGILLTFVVFHLALSDLQDLTGQAAVADFLLHTASPLLCVSGWLLFGPRDQTTWPVAGSSLVFLAAWGLFTMIRGAIVEWYPYPFMDPIDSGYARVIGNLVVVGGTFVALAAGAHVLDRHLAGGRPSRPEATPIQA
ncbi:MAG: Pr6Pr family membrane protein [Acidimicrobiia bacterium]|nr:Pr6Pr family membrane protein [Acidimicrobiia bacterium]